MDLPAPLPEQLLPRIAAHRIFARVPEAERAELAAQWHVAQVPRDGIVLAADDMPDTTCWLLDGDVVLEDAVGGRSVPLAAGEVFGFGAGPIDDAPWRARALTDCTVARLDGEVLTRWCARIPALQFHFPGAATELAESRSQGRVASSGDPQMGLMTRPLRTLLKRAAVTMPLTATIREAAQAMQRDRVSSVLIVEQERLVGLITDRDLRNRVVAQGLDTDRPLAEIVTRDPLTIDQHAPAFHAMLLMARHNIHHVPVTDGDRVLGMVTATDVTEHYSTSAVHLVGDIHKQDSVEGLVEVAAKVALMQRSLSAADASAYSSGHIITSVTDAITVRLLQMGEQRLGPPPVDYVWVAAGSQARSEQTAKSDQDNCMILDDAYDADAHGAYFKDLARFVCDGLNACGYVYCPGEMMAMTDKWRQPLARWREYFDTWVRRPEPMALMLTCVFFDLRAIHGRTDLLEGLRREVLAGTRGNGIFLAHMVNNALSRRPPLGMFGQISTPRSGEHKGTVDLKHLGIVPIVDLARVYALAGASLAVNTFDRLMAAADSGEISEASARDLRDALEFMGTVRIRHQARQIAAGEKPDNYLRPESLSSFERSQLKDAFGVVGKLQSVLQQRYTAGRF